MKSLNFSIYFLISSLTVVAQNNGELTSQQLKQFEVEAKKIAKEFAHYTTLLGTTNSEETQLQTIYKENIRRLFIPSANVEVINLSKRKNTYKIDQYLNVVGKYSDRFRIVILSFETINISENSLRPEKDEQGEVVRYRGKFSFTQIFCVSNKDPELLSKTFNPNDYLICERTAKTGEFILAKKYSPTFGNRWVLLLGNIHAKEINPL